MGKNCGAKHGGPRRFPPAVNGPVRWARRLPSPSFETIDASVRHRRRPYRDYEDDDPDSIGETLADVNDRLDDLSLQLARIARRTSAEDRGAARRSHEDDRDPEISLGEALAHFNRRLDQIVGPDRSTAGAADSTHAQSNWLPEFDRASAENAARPHAPDREPPVPTPAPPAIVECTQDLSGLENQLRQITQQIAALNQPCRIDDAVITLRNDLAEIGRAFNDAMPLHAVEELEKEVRALVERVDRNRDSGIDSAKFAPLERGLVEVRDTLRNLKPAENLVEVSEAVKGLVRKVDQITTSNHNPAALQKLDQVIAGLRGIVAHVASNDAVGKLANEVRALAAKFDQAAPVNSAEAISNLDKRITSLIEGGRAVGPGNESLIKTLGEQLDQRIAALIEGGRNGAPDGEKLIKTFSEQLDRRITALMGTKQSIPPELATQIVALGDKLDHIQLSQGDKVALSGIEERIVKLAGKLDDSDAWLGRLDAIERGMADLLVYLEDLRRTKPQEVREDSRKDVMIGVAGLPTVETAIHAPAQPSVSPSTAEPSLQISAIAAKAPSIPAPTPEFAAPVSSQAGTPNTATLELKPASPRNPVRRPINPDLPPDTPIEPSPDPTNLRVAAAERISASETALGIAKPAVREVASQFETLIAARRAAFAADAEMSTADAAAFKSGSAEKSDAAGSGRLGTYLRWGLLVASIIIIVLGAYKVGMDMWGSGDNPEPMPAVTQPPSAGSGAAPEATPGPGPSPAPTQDSGQGPGPNKISPAMPAPSAEPFPGAQPNDAPPVPPANDSSGPDPLGDIQTKPMPEVTGALTKPEQDPRRAPAELTLPVTIGGQGLRAAAIAGNPAAEYEIAMRYADGRGVTTSIDESARWLERAAKSGFAPAQFRLGGLYDKGGGLKKDRALARQLYTAAAEKGHAKAMHNLAVLYAEGLDGKPNYRMATQWFRKAAEYGIADSQYNLAILYIRGIGVEQNLAEAYKWFALAANQGDQEAAKKREEVAERIDEQTLNAAQQAVQTFVITQQPEQAVSLRAPPGGWDRANASSQPANAPPARSKLSPSAPDAPAPKSLLSPQPL